MMPTTGMLIFGKMSVCVVKIVSRPTSNISMEMTTNVYGHRSTKAHYPHVLAQRLSTLAIEYIIGKSSFLELP
jgi:hypothetical protein